MHELLTPPADPKAERFRRVAHAVVEILLQRGPSGIQISAVARRAGVSRAWIYKHFGNDTEALLDFTVRELGVILAGVERTPDDSSVSSWRRDIHLATREGLELAVAAPWGYALFFRYRHALGPLGEALREIEARHVSNFVATLPADLKGDPEAARAFALVFAAARLGVYAWWADPVIRDEVGIDRAVDQMMAMLDGFVSTQCPPGP